MIPAPARRLFYRFEAWRTAAGERRFLSLYDAVGTISDRDREELAGRYGLRRVIRIPPSVDLSKAPGPSDQPFGPGVIFTGSFCNDQKKQNLRLFLEAWHGEQKGNDPTHLFIVGVADRDILEWVRARYPGVTMTGAVPDTAPYYEKCAVAVIPEPMGGGFKMKALDAVARGKAIVAIKGAIGDACFEPGRHLVECQDLVTLVNNTKQLLCDREKQLQLASAAYDMASVCYSPETSFKALMIAIDG